MCATALTWVSLTGCSLSVSLSLSVCLSVSLSHLSIYLYLYLCVCVLASDLALQLVSIDEQLATRLNTAIRLLTTTDAVTSQAEVDIQQVMTSLGQLVDDMATLRRNVSRVSDAIQNTRSRVHSLQVSTHTHTHTQINTQRLQYNRSADVNRDNYATKTADHLLFVCIFLKHHLNLHDEITYDYSVLFLFIYFLKFR